MNNYLNNYYTEETAKKLVKIGFYKTVQYFKVINRFKDEIYHPKLPDPNELVEWLREKMNVYIVVIPDTDKPLGYRFNYFVYTKDGCIIEVEHFDYDSATIDMLLMNI
jgi:hypothetical protein